MKNIITAIGNPILNKELKKQENINILENDIKYKEELLEKLKNNKNIDYLIISEDIKGKINLINLLNKITLINKKIKIIIILEKDNNKLIEKLNRQKNYKIFIENEINIENIIEYINKDNLNSKKILFKNNIENNNKKIIEFDNYLKNKKFNFNENKIKNNKIISVIGNTQVGKTTFILMLLKLIKNKKILIIDCDSCFNEIQIILNSKNNQKDSIIKINKKISLYKYLEKNINKSNFYNEINRLKNYYDLIIFDNNYNNLFFENILKISDEILFLIEPNLLQINKSKILLEDKLKNNKELINKTKIIINKNNIYSINKKIIENIFYNFEIIGVINYYKKYSNLINNNYYFKFNKLKIKEIKKILLKI